MAILIGHGFDDGTLGDFANSSDNFAPVVTTARARTGTHSVGLPTDANGAGSGIAATVPSPLTTGWVYCAWYISAFDGSGQIRTPIIWRDNASVQMYVGLRGSDRKFAIYNAVGTQVSGLSTFTAPLDGWFQMAAKITVANAGGSVEVRFNGGATDLTFSGDTQNTANAFYTNVRFMHLGSRSNATNTWLDDVVLQDATGSAPENDWIGDVEASPIIVTADHASSGYVVGGTTPAATLYQSVNEGVPNEFVTTIDSAVAGDYASFEGSDMAAGPGTIFAYIVQYRAAKTTAGARKMQGRLDLGGTVALGPAVDLATSMRTYQSVFHRDPNSNIWTPANVNLARLGVRTNT